MAAYLNAKFHIRKDLSAVLTMRKGEREYAKAGKIHSPSDSAAAF